MRIVELHLQHFGRFQNHKMQMQEGLNVIGGGNESGKSTIAAFIRAMLFGIERRSGRGAANDEYSVRAPWDNPAWFAGTMTVEQAGRRYRIERSFRREDAWVRVIDVEAGRQVPGGEAAVQALLGGNDETTCMHTLFCVPGSEEQPGALAHGLTQVLTQLEQTPEGGDPARAIAKLRRDRQEAEAEKKRRLAQIDERIAEKRMRLGLLEQALSESAGGQGNQWEGVSSAQGRGNQWEDAVPAGGQGGLRGEAGEQRGRQVHEEMRSGEGDRRAHRDEPNRDEDRQEGSGLGRYLRLIALLCLGAGVLSGICAIIAQGTGRVVFLLLAVCLLGLSMGILAVQYDRAQRGQRGYGERAGEDLPPAAFRQSEAPRGLDMAAQSQPAQSPSLQGRLEEDREELNRLYEERDRLDELDIRVDALDLAMLRLREVSKAGSERVRWEVMKQASQILHQLTGGKYRSVSVDEKDEIRIGTEEKLLPSSQVSRATMQQACFALRMAAGMRLSGELPIVLDEPFARYDAERTRQALDWLRHSGRQVILFTCASQRTH